MGFSRLAKPARALVAGEPGLLGLGAASQVLGLLLENAQFLSGLGVVLAQGEDAGYGGVLVEGAAPAVVVVDHHG